MRNSFFHLFSFSLVLLFITGLSLALPASAEGLLDGKTFEAEASEKGKEDKTPDTLIFKDGMFTSTDCEQYGFKAAPYSATEQDGVISFESQATSDTEGTVAWSGTVDGGNISGTFVWTKPGQDAIEYTYSGKVK